MNDFFSKKYIFENQTSGVVSLSGTVWLLGAFPYLRDLISSTCPFKPSASALLTVRLPRAAGQLSEKNQPGGKAWNRAELSRPPSSSRSWVLPPESARAMPKPNKTPGRAGGEDRWSPGPEFHCLPVLHQD